MKLLICLLIYIYIIYLLLYPFGTNRHTQCILSVTVCVGPFFARPFAIFVDIPNIREVSSTLKFMQIQC